MPFSIAWEPEGIWRKFTGVASGNDLLRSQSVLHGDSRYYDAKYEIVDFLDISASTITATDAEDHLANNIGAAENRRVRVVAVITKDAGIAELAGRYAAHPSSPQLMEVFSTRDDARAWIGKNT